MQTLLKAGTKCVQIGNDYYPLNSLVIVTNGNKTGLRTVAEGRLVCNFETPDQYLNGASSNAPFADQPTLVTALISLIFA